MRNESSCGWSLSLVHSNVEGQAPKVSSLVARPVSSESDKGLGLNQLVKTLDNGALITGFKPPVQVKKSE